MAVHRTAQGQIVNMGALLSQNEEVIAVGNIKVNARGDELGPGGKIIRTRNQIMEEYYKTQSIQPTTLTASEQETIANAVNEANASVAVPDVQDPELTDEQIKQLKKRLTK